jgi:beta-catenin-like protein 1
VSGSADWQNILDIFDKAGDADGEVRVEVDDIDNQTDGMTLPKLRRLVGQFERVVAKNAEQRGKYPDDPTK